ncbi:MAG: proline dehydrogenase family protein, partial [bacterium]
MGKLDLYQISKEAAALAEAWQSRADELMERSEQTFQNQMSSLLRHPIDKVVLTQLIDQAFRSSSHHRVADQVIFTLQDREIPAFFTQWERVLVRLFLRFGQTFANLSVPGIVRKMRDFSSQAILPGESAPLSRYLKKRKAQGIRINVNQLGEAVLGEAECKTRLDGYVRDLENPEIEYISVKISTIYSQIHSLAFRSTVETLKERLSLLYRTARQNRFTRSNGEQVPKFVNLDMEEYRDLEITMVAFMETLDSPEFNDYQAGIVLQAYLPDSSSIQKNLTEWAIQRVKKGGNPVKLRIVKGANMEMEMVDSEINNWPLATYDTKTDVDANYKRMVIYGMNEANVKAVHLGIASHNLFELAFAFTLATRQKVLSYIDFEMLEGMA